MHGKKSFCQNHHHGKVYFWRIFIYPISWQIVTHSIIDMTWTLKKPKEAYPCSCTCCIHFHGRVRPKCFPNVSLALLTYSYFANHLQRAYCIFCATMCANIYFVCHKKKLLTATGNSSQTVWNDLDCFKLSKWSDESPLMARPLRLLFYLGLFLSIQTALPMHKVHNTIHLKCQVVILYALNYLPTILFYLFYDTQSFN